MRLTIDWGDQSQPVLLDDDSTNTVQPTQMLDLHTWATNRLQDLQHTYSQVGEYTITLVLSYFAQPGSVLVSTTQQLHVSVTSEVVIVRGLSVGTHVGSYSFGSPQLVDHGAGTVAALTPLG